MNENRIPTSPRTKVKRGSASLSARVKRKERLIEVLKHQAEGKGIRATAAALGVDPHTVIQYLRHYEELLDDTAKGCGRRLRTKALPEFLELNNLIMRRVAGLKQKARWTPDDSEELTGLAKAWVALQTPINRMFGVDLPEKEEVTGDGGKGLLAAAEKGPATYQLLQAMMAHGGGEASVTAKVTTGTQLINLKEP